LTSYAKAGNIAQEVFTAIRTVFAFNGAKKEHDRYVKNLDDAKFYGIKKGFLNGLLMGFLWLSIFGAYALGFWYGWSLSVPDPVTGQPAEYTVGKILLVFFSILIGVFSLGNAGPFFGVSASARAAAYEVFMIIDRQPSIDSSSSNGKKLDNIIGNISFENVKFSYPSRPDITILNGLNCSIESGLTCALVGSSGCGKSTCVQLLQRFYDPLQGAVKIDNLDIKELNVNWLRSNIGVVNQEPILFATTIAENIRFGKKDSTQEEIIQAAKNANAHDFIMTLPDKYETLCGERGSQLSGGQKQRIAIARALIRNPKILLLDEATSALDNESESIVQAALDKARMGRTTLVVAHRLSTIRNADIIFAFQNGVISESGTHEELMQLKGIYYNLVITQQADLVKKSAGNKKQVKEKEEEEEEEISLEDDSNSDKKSIKKDDDIKIDLNKEIKNEQVVNSEKKKKKSLFGKKDKKEEKVEKEKEPSMSQVFLMNRPEWGYIFLGCIASIVAGAIQPAFGIVSFFIFNLICYIIIYSYCLENMPVFIQLIPDLHRHKMSF
jgi:ATP-binding cassette, subfamily B (MDR/TAP), member 1